MRLEGRRPSAHLAGVSTALKIPPRMTVAEFLTWNRRTTGMGYGSCETASPR